MNRVLFVSTAALAAGVVSTASQAQTFGPSATGTAEVDIVEPSTIAGNGTTLDFGRAFRSSDQQTRTITPFLGGGESESEGSGASFIVRGAPNEQYQLTITVTDDVSFTNGSGPTTSLTLTNFTTTLDNPSNIGTHGDSDEEVRVGASLIIPPNAPAGAYTGTYEVTIENF
jgi:hypothetical protein